MFDDAGYTGLMKRAERQHQSDLIDLIDHIAMCTGTRRQLDKSTEYGQIAEAYEKPLHDPPNALISGRTKRKSGVCTQ